MMVSTIEDGSTEYKKDNDTIEVELHWDDGSAVKIIESVYNDGDLSISVPALFGCGKIRNLNHLSLLSKNWEIWRLRK